MSIIRIADLIALAEGMAGLLPGVVSGKGRCREAHKVRMAITVVARDWGFSYPAIGRLLNRDHSSVIYAMERAQILLTGDPVFAAFVADLRRAAAQSRPFIARELADMAAAQRAPGRPRAISSNGARARLVQEHRAQERLAGGRLMRNQLISPADGERDGGHAFHLRMIGGSRALRLAIEKARAAARTSTVEAAA